MFKKTLAVLIAAVLCVSALFMFAGCGNANENGTDTTTNQNGETPNPLLDKDFKVGFIFLHDENSTYDRNFMDAAEKVKAELGLTDEQVLFKPNVPEGNDCYEAAAELVDDGCDLIFADSFGHEDFVIQAAKEFTDVQFYHATGVKAHTEKLSNYHNGFASIYEGRYLAGIAAGMKLNEMIEDNKITAEQAKIGYIGAYDYAEVISGYTSFFLGARSVCPSATMDVKYTNSWFDIALEREAALSLIDGGCVVISQHADSEGAPKACEDRNVPNIAYNIGTIDIAPKTALISSKIDWAPYFKMIINAAANGTQVPYDTCYGSKEGAVVLTELNSACAAEGTQEKIDEALAAFEAGTLKVFDTSKFTVGGQTLTTYMADVDSDAAYTGDTEAISNGYFHESEYRSAPYFNILIDGITKK